MAAGYLGLSHPNWCSTILRSHPSRCAFWRGSERRFKVLEPGSPFFLLKKSRPGRPIEDRTVIGRAEYLHFDVQPIGRLPQEYDLNELGVASETELRLRLREIAGDGHDQVGVIVLGPLEPFRSPVRWSTLPRLGIKFARQVVSGMGLDETQVERLLDAGLYGTAD